MRLLASAHRSWDMRLNQIVAERVSPSNVRASIEVERGGTAPQTA
jgi:hypothetical protein